MDRAGCAMLAGSCQRFQERRERYRPAGEVIDPARFEVEPIEELTAKRFVERHHYSGSYPAACVRVGLFRRTLGHVRDLVGVAVFSVPPQPAAIPRWTGTHAGLELGRLVLLHDVPGNGESWFLGGAFRVLQAATRLRERGHGAADEAYRVARELAPYELLPSPTWEVMCTELEWPV